MIGIEPSTTCCPRQINRRIINGSGERGCVGLKQVQPVLPRLINRRIIIGSRERGCVGFNQSFNIYNLLP